MAVCDIEGDVEPFFGVVEEMHQRRSYRSVTARSGPASPHDWEKRFSVWRRLDGSMRWA